MSEEEIIKYLKNVIKTIQESDMLFDEPVNIRCGIKMKGAIQSLLDLYNEEKEYAMGLYYDTQGLQQDLDKERKKNDILQTNYEILQGEMDRIGIDTLGLEKGNSTDDVIEEIKLLLKEKENNREAIQYCKKDLAFKRRLEKTKETVDDYNTGRFDTSESILNILEE